MILQNQKKSTNILSYSLIFLASIIMLFGCGGNSQFKAKLIVLDSLLIEHPDSIYHVLESMKEEASTQPESSRRYYELLSADAQNKAYIDFTTDSIMKIVAEYYDNHGSANEKMRAHYLLGCTYRDLKDVPMELQCFQDAVEKADTTDHKCNLGTLISVYGQMADIYHSQYLPQEELKVLSMCEGIARKSGDTFTSIKAYELRLRAYNLLNMPDSVLSISQKARERYISIGNTIEATRLLAPAITILIDQEKYDEAYKYMQLFENAPFYKDSLSNINRQHAIHLYDIGRFDLHKNDIAEAKESFCKLMDFGYKEAAYRGLLSLYEKTNQPDSISKYAKLFALANDSSYVDKNTEVIAQMTAVNNYTRHQKIAKQKSIESIKAKNLVFLISMIAILIFCVAFILYGHLRYKSKEKDRLYIMQEKTLLKRYNETKEIIARLEKEMYSLETQKEEASIANTSHIEELLLTINNYEKEKEELILKLKGFSQIKDDLDFKAWYENFIACDATKKLHAKTIVMPNMTVKIEDKLWDELSEQIIRHCPAFLDIIDSYSLTPTYQHIVLLNTFDFSTSEISILLNKTVQQISNIHNRISKKIFPSCNETRKLKQNLLLILRDKRI